MRLLADSHVLVWWLDDPSRLSAKARAAIQDGSNDILVSAASVWELWLKIAKGKLLMPANFVDVLRQDGFSDLPIIAEHAQLSATLPDHHTDPFDRLLIAQAQFEGLVLLTRDKLMTKYNVPTLNA